MKIFSKIGNFVEENKSGIAIGLGLAFSLAGAFFTAKAAVKSKELIDEEKKRQDIPEEEKLPAKETVKICWKEWIPSVLSYSFSFASIISGKRWDDKKLAASFVAYDFLDNFARDYAEKVKEELGEEKEKDIRDKVFKDRKIPEGTVSGSEDYMLWDGDAYFWEPYFGKLFISNTVKIKDAVNEFNSDLNESTDGLPINDLFDRIWDKTPIALNKSLQSEVGDDLGYIKERGLLEPDYSETKDYYFNDGRMIRIPVLRFISKKTGQELIPTLYAIFS